jgi:hypothetical protein
MPVRPRPCDGEASVDSDRREESLCGT